MTPSLRSRRLRRRLGMRLQPEIILGDVALDGLLQRREDFGVGGIRPRRRSMHRPDPVEDRGKLTDRDVYEGSEIRHRIPPSGWSWASSVCCSTIWTSCK